MRPSDPISRAESWILRVVSPTVGLFFGGWQVATSSLTWPGVLLVLGLGVARPAARMWVGRALREPSSTPGSPPSGGSS